LPRIMTNLSNRLRIERRIICQQVDEVKTSQSKKNMVLHTDLLEVLKLWKSQTQLAEPGGWMFVRQFYADADWPIAVVIRSSSPA